MKKKPWAKEEEDLLKKFAVENYSYADAAKLLDRTFNSVRNKARTMGLEWGNAVFQEDQHSVLSPTSLRKSLSHGKAVPIHTLCELFSCKAAQVNETIKECRAQGFEVGVIDNTVTMGHEQFVATSDVEFPLAKRELIFGLCSDLHFGSKYAQISAFKDYVQKCYSAGARHILVAGDVTAGTKMFRGQELEVYAQMGQEQAESAAVNIPRLPGLTYHLMGGNHDASFLRNGGFNPLLWMRHLRPDIYIYSYDVADIELLPGVEVRLWHPSGGPAYAKSYRLQKYVAEVAFEELTKVLKDAANKPTIRYLACGHFHIQLQMLFGQWIWAAMTGCFEAQTDYLKRKGLVPTIGGWLINIGLDKENKLRKDSSQFILYDEVEDDWRNHVHVLPPEERQGPLFGGGE